MIKTFLSRGYHALLSASLIKQFTLMFGTTVFLLLSIAAFSLYGVLVHNLNQNDIRAVHHELTVISHLLQKNPNYPLVLKQQTVIEPLTLQKKKYYARIIAPSGIILYETPGMQTLFPLASFPNILHQHHYSKTLFVKTPDYEHYALSSMLSISADHSKYHIQLAYNTLRHGTELKKYRFILACILLISLIICPLIALFIAKKGLAPLVQLTQAIEQIDIRHLSTPIHLPHSPKELKTLSKAFNHLMKRLEETFQQLSQFSADLAHELRTPVHNLITQTEIVLSQERSPEEYQSLMLSSLEECVYLGQLIDRLLFLARAEHPHMGIEMNTIAVAEEVERLCEFFSGSAEEKQILLHWQGQATLKADRMLFQRAVSNLISNAIKYTPQGGNIEITIKENASRIMIEVQDSGCGIPQAHLKHIFDRFYRVEFARSKQTGGHGLGLAIVKKIMALHQGFVEIESDEDKGSLFRLVFMVQ